MGDWRGSTGPRLTTGDREDQLYSSTPVVSVPADEENPRPDEGQESGVELRGPGSRDTGRTSREGLANRHPWNVFYHLPMTLEAWPTRTRIAVLFAVLCFGLAGAPSQSTGHVAAIQAARERSNEALRRRDVDEIVAFLEYDARLTISSGRFVEGREAQRQAYSDQFAQYSDAVYVRTPTAVEISRVSPLASERGTWTGRWTADEGPVEMGGAYMAMWRKRDGIWRIRSELFVLLDCRGQGCPPTNAP